MGEGRNAYKVLAPEPGGKRSLDVNGRILK
jgi:hypothetical protein